MVSSLASIIITAWLFLQVVAHVGDNDVPLEEQSDFQKDGGLLVLFRGLQPGPHHVSIDAAGWTWQGDGHVESGKLARLKLEAPADPPD